MDYIFEIIKYILNLIIGLVLFIWYKNKKGWPISTKISIIYVLSWKTIILLHIMVADFLIELFYGPTSVYLYSNLYSYFFINSFVVSFLINTFFAIALFKKLIKLDIIDSVIIVIIIIMIELILESVLLYTILIPITHLS